MNALPYFLNASLYLLMFYGCYWLLLRRNTFFGLNRAYLLVSVGLSVALPLVSVPDGWFVGTRTSAMLNPVTLPTFVVGANSTAQMGISTADQWFWLIYGLGIAVMLARLGLNGRAVLRLIKSGQAGPSLRRTGSATNGRDYTLVRLPDDSLPSFSFGRYLVLNRTDAHTEPDALIRHEEAHIHQRHTADILFIEIMRATFWFNPLLLLYKRSLQEVHEFLADEAVARTTPRPDYARQLVAYALNVPSAMLTTPFVSVSTLKQRIVMLQKPQTNRRALLRYALVLPLAGLLTLCTQPEQDQPLNEVGLAKARTATKPVNVEGEIFTVVEEQPEFQGGMKGLGQYISQNLKYPAAAEKAKAHGRVFVNFVVTKSGEITDVKILKGIGFGADEEAVRMVSNMPRWKPGMQSGKTVNVRYNLPINFQLEEDDKKSVPDAQRKTSFFSVPTNDAYIQKQYKHFIVDGREVSFDEFRKYPKDAIVEASSSQQTLSIQTLPPPPPPPVEPTDASI